MYVREPTNGDSGIKKDARENAMGKRLAENYVDGDREKNCKVLKDSTRRQDTVEPRNCILFSPLSLEARTALTNRKCICSDTEVPLTVPCLEDMCGHPEKRAIMHIKTIKVYNLTPM